MFNILVCTHMCECEIRLSLPVTLEKVIDMHSVPSCCKAVQTTFSKFCRECGSRQPEKVEPTLMHGFQAKEDLRATGGYFSPSTVVCKTWMVEIPPSLTFNKKWPVVKTGNSFMIDVATGSTNIKRALSASEFVEAANSFNIPCTQDDLVIRCSSGRASSSISHVQL